MRWGLYSGGVMATLEETGQRYGVTRERVRQIEKKCRQDRTWDSIKESYGYIDSKKVYSSIGKKSATIYDVFFEYPKEVINSVIAKLDPVDKSLIEKRFGKNMSDPMLSSDWTSIDTQMFYGDFRNKMLKLLEQEKESSFNNCEKIYVSLYDEFDTIERVDLDFAVSKLKDHEKEILYKKYSRSLEGYVNSNFSSNSENQILLNIKKRIFVILRRAFEKYNSLYLNNKTIYGYFPDYNKNEIDEAIKKLDGLDLEAMKIKFGNNFDRLYAEERWADVSSYFYFHTIKKLTWNLKNPTKANEVETLYDIFSEYSKEALDEAVCTLSLREKELINNKYSLNSSLVSSKDSISVSDEGDIKLWNSIIRKLERYLKEHFSKTERERNIELKEYKRISLILHSERFGIMKKNIGETEATIVILKQNGISDSKLAKVLNLSEKEYLSIAKEALIKYQEFYDQKSL